MPKPDSTQHRLDRIRRPRVQVTYDVHTDGAIEKKELPFVMGVIGDFTGQPAEPLPKLKERKFVNIDRDNFDDVLRGMRPRLAMRVDNRLTDDDSQLSVELEFRSRDDFSPEHVVAQVEPLRRLLEARQKLSDLRNKMAGNDRLEELLQRVLDSAEQRQTIVLEAAAWSVQRLEAPSGDKEK